jgi:alpha,alpha-trehalase
MKNRILPCGLNAYGNSATKEVKVYMATEFEQRLGKKFEADREELGSNVLAECESGWDFSPRFNHRCTEYAPIDLNCIMYINEMVIATFESDLIEKQKYENFALLRKQKMLKYMFNGEFLNDAIPEKTVSNTVSVATLFPFLVGIQSDKITLKKLLYRLECKNGISACEKQNYNNTIYQWGYPNMWAPLVYFAFFALKQSGLIVDANRIGEKYLTAVEKTFEKTLKLWEKYDAETGEKATVNEYTETQMLGWTAGVYNLLFDLIRRKNEN